MRDTAHNRETVSSQERKRKEGEKKVHNFFLQQYMLAGLLKLFWDWGLCGLDY